MRKLIKKSLACCLVVALVLTAIVGTFATSAESVATVTAGSETVSCNGTSVTVPVTISVTDGFYAAYIQVASEFGALTAVSVPDDADYTVTADGYTSVNLETGKILVMSIYGDSLRNDMTEAVINCTFTAAETPAAGTYDVTVTLPDVDVPAADWAEYVVALTPVAGTITVAGHTPAAAVVENNVDATCYQEGSYDSVVYCSVETCKAEISRTPVTVEKIAHTPAAAVVENNVDATCYAEGSYDSVVYCEVEECKYEISRTPITVPVTDHTPAPAVEENRVEAQPGVAGSYDSVVYCSVEECKAEISRTPVEIPALPVGPSEPEVDPNLAFYRVSLAYGTSSLELNFRIANTVLDLYNNVEVVIVPQKYDMTTLDLVEEPAEIVIAKANLAAAGSRYKQYTYTDIQLYELGLNIDYMLRAYDEEGNLVAVSETYSTSAAAFLKKTYSESDDAKLRTLIADTLVVGQESVDMMKASYPNSDLADAVSIIEDFDTSEATPSIGECNDVDLFNSYNTNYGTANTFTHQVRKSVSIGKVPFLAIRTKDANSALDLSKLSYRVTYTSLNLDGTTVDYDKTFTDCSTKSGQFITFNFEEIGLGDGDKDIFIEVLYDGDKVYDMTYSMETYLSSQTSNASVGGVCTALLKLGAAFRAYATK